MLYATIHNYRLAPQGAGRPMPNLFFPFANSTLPPLGNPEAVGSLSPPKRFGLGLPPKLGDAKGDDPSPSSTGPTPRESRFERKLLLAFVNDPRPASDFLGSGRPNVKGNGAGMSTCLDLIGFGGGFAGDVGSLSLSLSLSLSRSRGRGIPARAD